MPVSKTGNEVSRRESREPLAGRQVHLVIDAHDLSPGADHHGTVVIGVAVALLGAQDEMDLVFPRDRLEGCHGRAGDGHGALDEPLAADHQFRA